MVIRRFSATRAATLTRPADRARFWPTPRDITTPPPARTHSRRTQPEVTILPSVPMPVLTSRPVATRDHPYGSGASGRLAANRQSSQRRKLCVTDGVTDCLLLAIPQPTEWQRIGN